MKKIRTDDQIIVLKGKDKGKIGKIIRSLNNDKVIVEGINIAKKHVKPNPNKGVEGGIINKTMPIHVSNVAIFNYAIGKADRVGFKLLADGRKVRFFKSTNEIIDTL